MLLSSLSLVAALLVALTFTGVAYGALVAAFGLALLAALPALTKVPRETDAARLAGAALATWYVVAVLASDVPYVSANAALGFALFFLAWAALASLPDARARARVLVAVGAVAAAVALSASWQYASGAVPTGPFVNKNNFAALLVASTFCMAGGLAMLAGVRASWRVLAALFVFAALTYFVIGVIGSRGAWLGAAAGFIVLFALAAPASRRYATTVAVAALCGLLLAQLSTPAGSTNAVAARIATLAAPAEAAVTRTVIWKTVAPLAAEHPLTGIGPGTLFLRWAAIRDPTDSSAGWHAHNDYLQFAVETGALGALLFVALLVVLLHSAWRARASAPMATWAAAGLAAVAVHSMFTFNFQLAPLLLVCGLMAGAAASGAVPLTGPRWATAARFSWYGALMTLAGLLAYAGTSVVGYHHQQQARAADEHGEFMPAYRSATAAIRWWPSADPPRQLRASILYKAILDFDGPVVEGVREAALAEALSDLREARRVNPYRAEPPAAEAMILRRGARLGLVDHDPARVEALYHTALALRPRFVGARIALAEFLEENGRPADALAVLRDGAHHWYERGPGPERLTAYIAELEARLGSDFHYSGQGEQSRGVEP